MNQIEYKDTDLNSVLDVDQENRTAKVVWNTADEVDNDQDVVMSDAYTATIKSRGPMGKQLIWSLTDHRASTDNVIGKPSELYMEGGKLIAVTKIADTNKGNDIAKLYNSGLINQHSIGFSTIRSEMNNETNVRTIKELKLYEGSVVLWGANENTPTLGMAKGLNLDEKKDFLCKKLDIFLKSFRNGNFTDETFSLMEIEIKQIQKAISEINTQAANAAPAPLDEKQLLDALKKANSKL
jgi:HK97 family phage prohead protease